MVTKEEAKEKIINLINKFSKFSKEKLDSMPEEDIKFQFIEPLFEALGWERESISKETRILKGRADYILKIGNQESLVVEAKKTNVSLSEDEGRQAVSYAYHRKIKFSVLTNFKYLRVYHALSNIKNIDKNLLFWLEVKDFEREFDRLWLLSKESFEKQEINKLLSKKDERINKPIDENILEDLLGIRNLLSKELKAKKNHLDKEIIDEVVQIMINRLIFIRSVEDRGLEPLNYLKSFESDVRQQRTNLQLFPYLLKKFEEFNKKYDSKLFESGLVEKEGTFSDDVLREVILILYFGSDKNQERYLFDQIPGDLFGSIYEQYLGTILSETEKRVKLQGETGKRKKMGIYYTPSYIVDYIVKNTVGEYIKGKSIDEILNVKILDPACGSGSFLTRAFVEVCNVIEDKLNKGEEGSKILFKSPKEKIEKLSLGQKIEILRNCIYGVDLDEKAIELAGLNLLLKLLDEESQETRKLLLPHLENNLKNGNSLVSDSNYEKAFNWNAQFPLIKEGGFDIVIGNPPYVDYSKIKDAEYFNKNYISSKVDGKIVKYNLFQLFIEKSIKLLKKGGIFGFINPNTYLSAENALALRRLMLNETSFKKIIDVSHLRVFKEASTYPVITIFKKGKKENSKLGVAVIENEKNIVPNLKLNEVEQSEFEKDKNLNFMIGSNLKNKEIISKLESYQKLKDYQEVFVWGSSITGFAKHKTKEKGNEKYSPMLQTRDIKRYNINWKKEYIENKIYSDKLKQLFKQKKIVIARVTKGIQATIDEQGYYIGKSSILIPIDKSLFETLLAIINSKLIHYYYKMKFETTHMAGGYIRFDIPYLKLLPIKIPDEKQKNRIKELVNRIMKFHKEGKTEQDIQNIDYEIDQEVYKLYGITPEEQKIIEESLR